MNTCEQCGKQMATRGGLEIHMELVHPPSAPAVEAPIGEVPAHRALEPARHRATRPAPAMEWHVPHFLHTVDPTLPVTALLVFALFFAGLVAALHRGSGHSPLAVGAQAAVPAVQTPPVAVDPAGDQKLAQSLVLTQLDYPDGWTITPHNFPPDVQVQSDRALAICLGLPDPANTRTATATGPDGHETGAATTTTRVLVFRSPQQAAADFAALGGPTAIGCLKDEVTRTVAASGLAVRDVGMGRFAVSSGSVRNVALHCEVVVTDGQGTGVVQFDSVFMQQGRVEGELAVLSADGQFPPDTEQTLVTRLAHKLANA
jgi:hypothetical protein